MGDKFSREGGFMQICQDKFPGIDNVFDHLPHLGELFLRFFPLYTKVRLVPSLPFKGIPASNLVALHVLRHGSSAGLFNATRDGLAFILYSWDIYYHDFKIGADHVGQTFPVIAGKFRIWLENRILEKLDAFNFQLALSEESMGYLTSKKKLALLLFVPQKWSTSGDGLQKLKFHVTIENRAYACPGLAMPLTDDYLSTTWDYILPQNSNHHKLIALLVRWHCQWYAAKTLIADDPKCINLEEMWERYKNDVHPHINVLK